MSPSTESIFQEFQYTLYMTLRRWCQGAATSIHHAWGAPNHPDDSFETNQRKGEGVCKMSRVMCAIKKKDERWLEEGRCVESPRSYVFPGCWKGVAVNSRGTTNNTGHRDRLASAVWVEGALPGNGHYLINIGGSCAKKELWPQQGFAPAFALRIVFQGN